MTSGDVETYKSLSSPTLIQNAVSFILIYVLKFSLLHPTQLSGLFLVIASVPVSTSLLFTLFTFVVILMMLNTKLFD